MKKLLLPIALLLANVASAQVPSVIDSSFGKDGHLIFRPSANINYTRQTTLSVNDSIITTGYIGGANDDIFITKITSDGALAPFGNKGTVILDPQLGANDRAESTVQLSDGKLLVCGTMTGNQNLMDVFVMRLNQDGSIDNTFSNNGMSKFDVFGGDFVSKMVVYNSKIYIGVHSYSGGKYIDAHIIRMNIDGTLDQTYGNMGLAKLDPKNGDQENLYDFEIAKDGSIVAVGRTRDQALVEKMFMVKIKPEGKIDSSFGTNGYLFHTEAGFTRLMKLKIDDDNSIYWAGYHKVNAIEVGLLVKVDKGGTISTTFGSGNGKVPLSISAQDNLNIKDIQLLDSGRIMAVGFTSIMGFVAVFEKDGSKHTAYNGTGYKVDSVIDTFMSMGYDDIMVQSDGKIVISGYMEDSSYRYHQHLVRYKKEEPAVSVKELDVVNIYVYPNPTSGTINISLPTGAADKVSMYNLQGQEVATWQNANVITAPDALPAGMYILKVSEGTSVFTKSIFLNR